MSADTPEWAESSRQKDGPSCPGCGLPNWQGLCPHCQGDRDRYERELVPPFPTTRDPDV